MKLRLGFVSNSSSASFILDKRYMSGSQMFDVMQYVGPDGWTITEDEDFIRGDTCMDNEDIAEFFKKIDLRMRAIVKYERDF